MPQLSEVIKNIKLPNREAIESAISIGDATKIALDPDFSQAPVRLTDNQAPVNLAAIQSTIDAITKQTQAIAAQAQELQPKHVAEPPVSPVEPVKTTFLDQVLGKDPARERAEKELARITKERAEVEKVPTAQEALTEAAGFFGIDPETFKQLNVLSTQIGTIVTQIAAVDTREQQALLNKEVQLQGRPGTIIRGEQNLIKRQFAIEKSGLAAQASALASQAELIQGNFDNVRNLANQYIANATYQRQQTIDDLNWASDIYEDVIDDLDEADKNAWEELKEQYEAEQKKEVKEKEDVRDLMLDNPTAGINLTDTLDEATLKAQQALIAAPKVERSQVVEIAGEKRLINLETGEVIKTLGPAEGVLRPTEFSGEFTQAHLAQRAGDYVTEDGGVDWIEVDKLENVNKNLWGDMTLFLQRALESTIEAETQAGIEAEVAKPQIEKDIDEMRAKGRKASDIRFILGRRGYSKQEIDNSSAGTFFGKAGQVLTGQFDWLLK